MLTTRIAVPVVFLLAAGTASAQVASRADIRPGQAQSAGTKASPAAAAVVVPPEYVIGPDDLLSIMFWQKDIPSLEVTVRPDGKISLPLLNDVQAAGLTPLQLRERLTESAQAFQPDAEVAVVVRQVNSRKVFVSGEVNKPGEYRLTGPTTVLQMLSLAGGLREYAKAKDIAILRAENGRTVVLPFNYKDVTNRKNLQQNIELKPGDTIMVP
jgi:polysaccharide export outer membrane protein